jgi:hypothetical protein
MSLYHPEQGPEDRHKHCLQALDAMEMMQQEQDESVRLYERYLCAMAMLRVQRESMLQQLCSAYELTDTAWLQQLASEKLQKKNYLSVSATIETLHIWLRKETELFCDLLSAVVMDVRCCFVCANGRISLLESLA